ncbi:MAG: hypothetical protein IPJ41_04820 [Phycisphaerales bacterium]|nr:hypothetical protein [Phycisphaerales bacterium]
MATPQLTEADYAELARAGARLRPIRRAAAIAKLDGTMLACFGVVSLLAGLFGATEFVTGCVLMGLAWNELAAGSRLLRLDPAAPRRLAINQLLLAGAVVGYAAWKGYQSMHAPSELASHSAELDSIMGAGGGASLERFTAAVSVGVYGALAIGSIICQGLTSWYYASRGGILRKHLASTPEWVVRIERIVRAA